MAYSMAQTVQELQNALAKLSATQKQLEGITEPDNLTSISSYPRAEPQTAEDIISNQQWNNELKTEFANSEWGKKAASYADVLFLQFVEKQTGKPSSTLKRLNESEEQKEVVSKPEVVKKAGEKNGA